MTQWTKMWLRQLIVLKSFILKLTKVQSSHKDVTEKFYLTLKNLLELLHDHLSVWHKYIVIKNKTVEDLLSWKKIIFAKSRSC